MNLFTASHILCILLVHSQIRIHESLYNGYGFMRRNGSNFVETHIRIAQLQAAPQKTFTEVSTVHGESDLFFNTLDTDFYVDHSLLIEYFLKVEKSEFRYSNNIFVSAPPGFGKSLNLRMMYHFFSHSFSKEGKILDKYTSIAYEKFTKKRLKITETPFFKDHFGTRAVLFFDFGGLKDFADLCGFLRKFSNVLNNAVEMFPFIKTSTDPESQRFMNECVKFEETSLNIHKEAYIACSVNLTELLAKHFGGPILLLIDEATMPHEYMLSGKVSVDNIKSVHKCMRALLVRLLEGNDHVWRAFLTGLTEWWFYDSSSGSFKRLSIFNNNGVISFYGFSETEVNDLLDKIPNLSKSSKEKAMFWMQFYFSGFRDHYPFPQDQGQFFCPRNIIQFLLHKTDITAEPVPQLYANTKSLHPYKEILAPRFMGTQLLALLEPGKLFKIESYSRFRLTLYVNDLINLRTYVELNYGTPALPIFYCYLISAGFKPTGSKSGFAQVYNGGCTNQLMRYSMEEALLQKHYFTELFGTTEEYELGYERAMMNLENKQETVESVTKAIAKLIWQSGKTVPQNKYELATALYIFLQNRRFATVRREFNSPFWNSTKRAQRFGLIVDRKDGKTIIVEVKWDKHPRKGRSYMTALKELVQNKYVRNLKKERPNLGVYMLLGVYMNSEETSCGLIYNSDKETHMVLALARNYEVRKSNISGLQRNKK